MFIPSGQQHHLRDNPGRPLSILAVCVAQRLICASQHLQQQIRAGVVLPNPGIAGSVSHDLRQLLFEQTTAQHGYEVAMIALAQHMLVRLARCPQQQQQNRQVLGPRQQVCQFVRRLDQRFFHPLSIEDAAQELNISRRSFTGHFRELTGTTLNHFIRERRIHHARNLLATTDRTVLSIAFECGYENLSTFYRAFNTLTRNTPQQWRTQIKPSSNNPLESVRKKKNEPRSSGSG